MFSDEAGLLTDVCLISSDLGNTPGALACAAAVARESRPKVDPKLVEEPWVIFWFLD